MALDTGPGKRVNGGVTPTWAPRSSSPAGCPPIAQMKKLRPRLQKGLALGHSGQSRDTPTLSPSALPSTPTFCLARVGPTLLFSTAPGSRPGLETDGRLGGPWGPAKIPPVASSQGGRAPSLPAVLAFLASPGGEGASSCTCPLWGPGIGPGHRPHVSLACGEAAPGSPGASQSPSRKQMARCTGTRGVSEGSVCTVWAGAGKPRGTVLSPGLAAVGL